MNYTYICFFKLYKILLHRPCYTYTVTASFWSKGQKTEVLLLHIINYICIYVCKDKKINKKADTYCKQVGKVE